MKHHSEQEHREACVVKHNTEADEPLKGYAAAGEHGVDDEKPVQQAETECSTEQEEQPAGHEGCAADILREHQADIKNKQCAVERHDAAHYNRQSPYHPHALAHSVHIRRHRLS